MKKFKKLNKQLNAKVGRVFSRSENIQAESTYKHLSPRRLKSILKK